MSINIIVFEIFILISGILFLFYQFVNKKRYRIPFFVGIFTATIAESINEFVFHGQGTYYPDSLIYFPFLNFTVAIIVAGALFAVFIHFATVKTFNSFMLKNSLWKYLIFTIFMMFSIPFELVGLWSGYWVLHKGFPKDEYVLFYFFSVYIFYVAFTLPVFIVSELKNFDKIR